MAVFYKELVILKTYFIFLVSAAFIPHIPKPPNFNAHDLAIISN